MYDHRYLYMAMFIHQERNGKVSKNMTGSLRRKEQFFTRTLEDAIALAGRLDVPSLHFFGPWMLFKRTGMMRGSVYYIYAICIYIYNIYIYICV